MKRNVFAVAFGFGMIGSLVALTGMLFPPGIVGRDTITPTLIYDYALIMVSTAVYSILGGWTCAFLAKPRKPAMRAFVILGELAAVAVAAYFWTSVPHRYFYLFFVLYPFAVLFGEKNFEWTRPV